MDILALLIKQCLAHRVAVEQEPARLRMLAYDMAAVGAAVRYYGGFGPFAAWGSLLEEQSAPMCLDIAANLERMRGGRA